MTIQPARPYLSIPELAERWKIPPDALDLRRAVLSGVLRPCIVLGGILLRAQTDDDGQYVGVPDGEDGYLEDEFAAAWMYPTAPEQIAPFEAIFKVVTDRANPVQGGGMWALEKPITLSQVLAHGAVMEQDILDAEAVLKVDRSITTKETNSLLKLITILVYSGFGWRNDGRSDIVRQIVNDGAAIGISISEGTTRTLLRQAWTAAEPEVPLTRTEQPRIRPPTIEVHPSAIGAPHEAGDVQHANA